MKFVKNIIALACLSAFTTHAMQESKELLAAHTAKSPLLSVDEVARISDHMYSRHKWQMNLLKGPDFFTEMAHGNDELEEDLKAIYQIRGYSSSMLALHDLCLKWGFNASKVRNDLYDEVVKILNSVVEQE